MLEGDYFLSKSWKYFFQQTFFFRAALLKKKSSCFFVLIFCRRCYYLKQSQFRKMTKFILSRQSMSKRVIMGCKQLDKADNSITLSTQNINWNIIYIEPKVFELTYNSSFALKPEPPWIMMTLTQKKLLHVLLSAKLLANKQRKEKEKVSKTNSEPKNRKKPAKIRPTYP